MTSNVRTLQWLPVALGAALLLAALSPKQALAQVERRNMDARIFAPALDNHGIFTVDRAEVGSQWDWGFRLGLHAAGKPINLRLAGMDPNGTVAPVSYSVAVHLGFHLTFTRWLSLAADVPFLRQGMGDAYDASEPGGFTYNDPISNMTRHAPGVVAGDPRLALKFRLFEKSGFSMAVTAIASIPFGDEGAFAGDRSFTLEPRIIATYTRNAFTVSANLGYLYRRENIVYEPTRVLPDTVLIELDDELTWGLGAAYRVAKFLSLGAELYGRGPLLSDKADLPMEALAGMIFHWGRLSWSVGGGVGIGSFIEQEDLKPYGRTPLWRFFTLLSFVPTALDAAQAVSDRDGDGIPDHLDQCPDAAEDFDGFEDEDGCPDPDNDQDGIPDHLDKCPDEAEDFDGFEDEDGCPELDNDGDGIPDVNDRCPGVDADKRDDFKMTKEDMDGFEDDDGCPDFDNDGDGIPDHLDQCPNEPEDFNGVDDEDGCPDGEGGTTIAGGRIDLAGQRLMFKTGSAEILDVSFPLLNKIVNTLRNNPGVRLVRIEGHTDDVGNAAANLRLSQERAVSVLNYLVKRGVTRDRLTAVGYGQTRPKVPNTDAKSRAENRRVEFIIVHQTSP